MVARDGTLFLLFSFIGLMVLLLVMSTLAVLDFRVDSLKALRVPSVSGARTALSGSLLSARVFLEGEEEEAPADEEEQVVEEEASPEGDLEDGSLAAEGLVIEGVLDEHTEEEGETFEPSAEALGFVANPVVRYDDTTSIFALSREESAGRVLTEAEIAERCSHISIPFNRDRCLRAERACAAVVATSREHLDCLKEQGYFGASNLSL